MAERTGTPSERRRDDRLRERVYRLAAVLVVFMMAISVVGRVQAENDADAARTRSDGAEQDRDRLAAKIDEAQTQLDAQQHDLACFADNTTRWERAISDVIVASVSGAEVTPERQQAALDELERVNEALASAKSLCETQPPPGTTTTTAPG